MQSFGLLQNDHINGLLNGSSIKFVFYLKKGPKFWNFACLEGI